MYCSLAGRYDNPIPTRFLAPKDLVKNSSSGPKEFEIPENLYGLLHTRSWERERERTMHVFLCPLALGFYGKMAHNNMLRLIWVRIQKQLISDLNRFL
jgi:hypothetical protein